MSLVARGLNKSYRQGDRDLEILKNLSLEMKTGETLAVLGQSGSGKSTLLSLLAGLDRPDQGSIEVENVVLTSLSEADVTAYRGAHIGIVFQQFHLMPHLTAVENVALPAIIAGQNNWRDRSKALLSRLGLGRRTDHFPSQLSGGECQRIAIARALITSPALILADEPTGNLDSKTAAAVSEEFFQLTREQNVTVLLVTHNSWLAGQCGRQAELREGQLWF